MVTRIRRAWEVNCIALFRGQSLDEMDQVRFAARLGPLGAAVNDLDPDKGGAHPAVLYVSNVRVNGIKTVALTGLRYVRPARIVTNVS